MDTLEPRVMSSTVYFRLVSIAIMASGLVGIAAPEVYSELLGMQPSDAATLWTRAFAVTAVGLAIVAWAVSNSEDAGVRRALAWALLVTFGLNTAFGVLEAATAVTNLLGWSFVLFDTFVVAGALYVLWALRTEAGAADPSR